MAEARHNCSSLLFPPTDHTSLIFLEAQLEARVLQALEERTEGWMVTAPHSSSSVWLTVCWEAINNIYTSCLKGGSSILAR